MSTQYLNKFLKISLFLYFILLTSINSKASCWVFFKNGKFLSKVDDLELISPKLRLELDSDPLWKNLQRLESTTQRNEILKERAEEIRRSYDNYKSAIDEERENLKVILIENIRLGVLQTYKTNILRNLVEEITMDMSKDFVKFLEFNGMIVTFFGIEGLSISVPFSAAAIFPFHFIKNFFSSERHRDTIYTNNFILYSHLNNAGLSPNDLRAEFSDVLPKTYNRLSLSSFLNTEIQRWLTLSSIDAL